jgi:hypothetical protein
MSWIGRLRRQNQVMNVSSRGLTPVSARIGKTFIIATVLLGGYALLAYVVLPSLWTHYER